MIQKFWIFNLMVYEAITGLQRVNYLENQENYGQKYFYVRNYFYFSVPYFFKHFLLR
jgi:hypothetical protein